MTTRDTFPVRKQSASVPKDEMAVWPCSILWAMVEQWRERIELDHHQTLEEVADAGGLTPAELWLASRDLELGRFSDITERKAAAWLATEILRFHP